MALKLTTATRGAPDPDPDPAGYPVFFQDPVGYGSGWIHRIRRDPNSLDPVNRIHYHVVVPITVSKHCVYHPMSGKCKIFK